MFTTAPSWTQSSSDYHTGHYFFKIYILYAYLDVLNFQVTI